MNNQNGDKRKNIISLEVLGQTTVLATQDILNVKNNRVSQKLHQVQTQEGKWEYIHKTNEDILLQYKESITNARERVAHVNKESPVNVEQEITPESEYSAKAQILADTISIAEDLRIMIAETSEQIRREEQQRDYIDDKTKEGQEGH